MAGAPRIFEKVRARVIMGASHGVKGKIFNWAFDVGHKTVPMRLAGRQPQGLLGVQYALADRLVFSKIKARMGGKIRFFVSGSAALSREVQEWFYAAGLLDLGRLRADRDRRAAPASTIRGPPGSEPSDPRCRAPRSRSPPTARS